MGIVVMDKPADSLAFVKEKHLGYPSLVDQDMVVASKFGVRGLPTVVLLDRHGKLAYQGNTLPTQAQIDKALK